MRAKELQMCENYQNERAENEKSSATYESVVRVPCTNANRIGRQKNTKKIFQKEKTN